MSLDAAIKSSTTNAKQTHNQPAKLASSLVRIQVWSTRYGNQISIAIGLLLFVAVWSVIVKWGQYPPFILPSPSVVAHKFVYTIRNGTLIHHTWTTVTELALGLTLGLTCAFLLGYILGKNPQLERFTAPFIVASQSIPIVAIAPLLIIWFGSGLLSKVLVCALITFFPTLINTIVGIRNVDADLQDLMRSLRAGRWQTFQLLELPAAAPYIFGGLKLSVILSVVGAVVGEFVGADSGLGFLINLARGVLDTPLMFVAIISLIFVAQILYLAVSALEAHFLHWQHYEQ